MTMRNVLFAGFFAPRAGAKYAGASARLPEGQTAAAMRMHACAYAFAAPAMRANMPEARCANTPARRGYRHAPIRRAFFFASQSARNFRSSDAKPPQTRMPLAPSE